MQANDSELHDEEQWHKKVTYNVDSQQWQITIGIYHYTKQTHQKDQDQDQDITSVTLWGILVWGDLSIC